MMCISRFRSRYGFISAWLCLAPLGVSFAQALPAGDASAPGGHGDAALVAPVNGPNFSLDFTSQHNSATGWANILSPDLSFRFNRHLSVSGLVPVYLSVNAYVPVSTKGVTSNQLQSTTNVLGDTILAVNYEASHNDFNYLGSVEMGLPTGNSRFGLSGNQVTYNVINHFDYTFGPFDPDIEVGVGDSSSLTHPAIRKAYTAVGPLANFQAGTSVDMPFGVLLDLEAYENLPIGNQTVYGTVTRTNKRGRTLSRQVLEGTGAAEDNGFLSELDIPIRNHFLLSGTYERSLLQGLDTVSAGITWTLRRPKPSAHGSN